MILVRTNHPCLRVGCHSYGEHPLFIGTPMLLCGNSYLLRVRVVIYERPITDRIHRIRQVIEASIPRRTFNGGMRDAA
jgi:hypothetical protein